MFAQSRFPWVFKALDDSNDDRGDLDAAQLFPDLAPEQQLQQVQDTRRWLDAQPLARRVLVKVGAGTSPQMIRVFNGSRVQI